MNRRLKVSEVLNVIKVYPANFSRSELIRSTVAQSRNIDNTPNSIEIETNLILLAHWLQALRDKIKSVTGVERVIKITSGYRSEALNSAVSGASTSAHIDGRAADFIVFGMSTMDVAKFISTHMADMGWDQLIEENGRWVHIGLSSCDTLPRKQIFRMRKDPHNRTIYLPGLED